LRRSLPVKRNGDHGATSRKYSLHRFTTPAE
jgi:hypothetical protein